MEYLSWGKPSIGIKEEINRIEELIFKEASLPDMFTRNESEVKIDFEIPDFRILSPQFKAKKGKVRIPRKMKKRYKRMMCERFGLNSRKMRYFFPKKRQMKIEYEE